MNAQVRRGDVLAAWSGIRPLVLNPSKKETQELARNHIVHVSDGGLVTGSSPPFKSQSLLLSFLPACSPDAILQIVILIATPNSGRRQMDDIQKDGLRHRR